MVEYKREATKSLASKASGNKLLLTANSVYQKKFSVRFLDEDDDLG